jgi:tRNA A-37 threonylcarbamoyl transferase component Bud32
MKSLATTSATLQSNPFARWTALIIWIIVALLSVGLSFVDVAKDYSQIRYSCEGAWTLDGGCNFLAISSTEAEVLTAWGLTLQSYAIAMTLSTLIPIIVYAALGLLILWQQKANLLGLTVSLALVIIPFITISGGGEDWAAINPHLFLPGVFASLIGNIIGICFLYLIPNGRFSPRWAYIPMTINVLIASILSIHVNDIITLSANVVSILITTMMSLILLSVGLQVYRYLRVSNTIERQQTKWILFGVAIFFASMIAWVPLFGGAVVIPAGIPRLLASLLGSYFISLLLIVLPVAITIAIFRYNLWNIDIAINRSLVGLIVTIVLAFVFFASVVLVQNVVNAKNPLVGFAVSAIGPVLLFNPTRKRVRHFIDRRVYGFAFDLDELNAVQRQQHIINYGALSGVELGDYTVLDVIGKGGMGEVYKGQGNGQTVAIKTMLPEIAADPAMRVRFMREAEIGQTLNHPGIAKVYTSGDYHGTPYLVMEYINGDDISQQLKRGEKYDTETATTIMTQVCEALDMAHSRGYVHRDIKPSNIMLRENGTAVLMDFGVTKVDGASVGLTGTGTVGTIAYMAPEQIKASKDVDYHADIYALGVMLYEILTGQQPFTGGPAQVLFAHLQQPAPDPRDVDDTIPDAIADAILMALEKEPENRFQSAGQFAAALNFHA